MRRVSEGSTALYVRFSIANRKLPEPALPEHCRFLSEPTLEMLADMRGQFAHMLADAGLVDRSAAATSPKAGGGGADGWDDIFAPWNRHAGRAAVVSVHLCRHATALYFGSDLEGRG